MPSRNEFGGGAAQSGDFGLQSGAWRLWNVQYGMRIFEHTETFRDQRAVPCLKVSLS